MKYFLTLMLFSGLLLTACDKDKKLEKKATKKTGEWQITSATWTSVRQNLNDFSQTITSGTSTNVGTISFTKDSWGLLSLQPYQFQGTLDYLIGGHDSNVSIAWEGEKDSVVISYIQQQVTSQGFDQHVITYAGVFESKKKLVLYGADVHQADTIQEVLEAVLTLER